MPVSICLYDVAVGIRAAVLFVGVVELAAQMLEGLPGDARRVVGLPRCGASCHFVELLEPRGRQPLGGHPAGGHRVVAAAVERCGHVGRDDAGTAGDILAAGDPASVVVAYAAAVARASA